MNFWLRKAGAGRLSLDDLNAAASIPVEVDEEQVVEAADEGKEEPESEEFWTVLVARARANEQANARAHAAQSPPIKKRGMERRIEKGQRPTAAIAYVA